ncbi:retinol-binding protein pinta-like isoform X3 [Periplaneta americana]|uniref:retinol-binding protein pinta-like isoform X3 n=1 Tax=Periplaneta americana TaxID=6978 RepID=UPI0037E7583E
MACCMQFKNCIRGQQVITPVLKMAMSFFKDGMFQKPKEYEEDIKLLRCWTQTQPHLPSLSDEHLYLFLHSCERSLARTKATIEQYYTLRTHTPDLFGNRDPSGPDVKSQFGISQMMAMTRTTPEGYRVLLYRLTDYDSGKYSFIGMTKAFFMFNDVRLAEDGLEPGYVIVFDLKGATLGHLAKVTLTAVRKCMIYVQLHFHGPVEELEKYFPLEILPEDYGGKSESCETIHAKQQALVQKYTNWFQQEEAMKVDESKRIGKRNLEVDSYGAEGSFRKLAID